MSEQIELSVVLPVFNEEMVLPSLFERLSSALPMVTKAYEVIFVDDGSRDRSLDLLREIHEKDPRFKYLSFSRNFGHQTAISAGLQETRGDIVAVMDADLQDPPEVLPSFIEKLREGYEVVYAIRTRRKESALKRAMYSAFYRILQFLSDIPIPLDAGDFCVMDRKIVELLGQMPERNRFVRGIRSWVGFRQVGMAYERQARQAGEPKYTFRKLLKLAFDGIISFSFMPLRLATMAGFIVSGFAFLYGIATLFQKLFTTTTVRGYSTTVILICFIGGVQLITVGILGEYLGRIYDEVKKRPLFVLKDKGL